VLVDSQEDDAACVAALDDFEHSQAATSPATATTTTTTTTSTSAAADADQSMCAVASTTAPTAAVTTATITTTKTNSAAAAGRRTPDYLISGNTTCRERRSKALTVSLNGGHASGVESSAPSKTAGKRKTSSSQRRTPKARKRLVFDSSSSE